MNLKWTVAKPVEDFCALRAEKSSKPAFAYLFARPLPGDDNGAFHSADLWYVFHSFSHSWRPFTSGDEELSNKIVDYWTNFAKYGNPNGKGEEIWAPYSSRRPELMKFDVDGDNAVCIMTGTPEYKGNNFRRE